MGRFVHLALFLLAATLVAPVVSAESTEESAVANSWLCDQSDLWLLVGLPWHGPNWLQSCTNSLPVAGPVVCSLGRCDEIDQLIVEVGTPINTATCITGLCPTLTDTSNTAWYIVMGIIDDVTIPGPTA